MGRERQAEGGAWQAKEAALTRGLGAARAVFLFVAAAVVLVLIGLSQYGLPEPMVRRLVERLSHGDFAVELDDVTLDLPGGLMATSVRVYRKGDVGPAVFEAGSVRVAVHPAMWRRRGLVAFREIDVWQGVVRPGAAALLALPSSGGAGGTPALSAHCRLHEVDLVGVWIERASATVQLDAQALRVTRLSATVGRDLQRGTLAGSLTVTADGLQARLTTAFDPHVLVPGFKACGLEQTRVFDWFSFPAGAPSGELTLEQRFGAAPAFSLQGRLQATQFAYRGTAIGFGNLSGAYIWSPTNHTLKISPLVLVVGGRNISGTLGLDLGRETLEVEAVSIADVPALARIAGFREGSFLDEFRFARDTRVYVRGHIGYGDSAGDDAYISVDSPSIGCRGFVAEDCAVKVRLAGVTNILQDVRGRLAGGSFTAQASFAPSRPGSSDMAYTLRGEVLHADLRQLIGGLDTNLAERLEGRLYGNLDLKGIAGAGHGRTASGQGSLNVKRGTLFRIPLFGGFTDAMMRVVPGLDFVTRQTDARAPFEVREGRVWSRDVQIEGDVLSLTGRGSVAFDGRLDFDVQVRPMKDKTLVGTAMRALAYPISKLFEFRLQGDVAAPHWSSAAFSRGDNGKDRE
jgi:hypothetical protein